MLILVEERFSDGRKRFGEREMGSILNGMGRAVRYAVWTQKLHENHVI